MRLEQAWGCWRRGDLKTFRPRYVARMAELRKGHRNQCPHEVLDSRDVKFHLNHDGYYWDLQDDPFAWRDRLPFARAGLAELFVLSLLLASATGLVSWLNLLLNPAGLAAWIGWFTAAALGVIGLLIVWFFRDPQRAVPDDPGLVVSPADGTVVLIEELDDHEFIDGPAVLIGIFLSIFNVHINRVPIPARVLGMRYQPGKFLNALSPRSARENEQLAVRIEGSAPPHRRMIVRQIAGAIARRIVCRVKPGDELDVGERFGMIKLGSRTELVLPRDSGIEIRTHVGQKVKAGSSVLAAYID